MRRTPLRIVSALALLAAAACGTRTIDVAGDVLDGATVKSDGGGDAPSASFTACDGQGGACTLTVPNCCGTCGAPALGDFVAVSKAKLDGYRASVCPDPGTMCPDCVVQEAPDFQAVCRGGGCVAIDVSKDELSACTTNADCALRYASCCESCDGSSTGLIALAKTQLSAYAQAICDPAADCPNCAPSYPSGKRAVCNATKHCSVL